ncbi:MAG: choice-of-anchor R domain-containing protein, partial [Syntrophales bacterium]
LLDNPTFDPNFATDVPALLQWTETKMVAVSTGDGLYGSTGVYYGAHVPAEQTAYMWRMGYQTSRQAAEYARWYAISGDETHRDIAYRGFNYSTYMMKSTGESSDGPSDGVGYWWSDCYGEGPRMFFHGFAGVAEWAPPGENHILYSKSVLKDVSYASGNVQYTPTDGGGIEYLRLAFLPTVVTVDGVMLSLRTDLNAEGYTVRDLGNGDYAVNIRRMRAGDVVVFSGSVPVTFTITASAGTGGAISPSGNVLVNPGADATFSITASSGYAIVDVEVDGASVGAVSSYTFTNVTANHSVDATFSEVTSSGGIIGYDGEGTTTDNISDASGTYINATRFGASVNLNVTTVKAKVLGITGKYKAAIYSDNNGVPQTLLRESAEVTNPTTGWQTFALTSSQSIVSGTYYWLAIWSSLKSTSAGVYCDPSGATTRWTNALTYGTWPSPINTTGGGNYRYCIYAEDPGSSRPANFAPTVVTAAAASPNPVTGSTTALSVLGADDGGEANLTYTWATTGTPPAAVTSSVNGTNGAKNTTVTFSKAGSYSFQVTIKDQGNLTVTSSVNVTVNQTLTTITVSPASASVNTGATQQFTASAKDQFGTALSTQPSLSWSVSGGGTISTGGLFTASSTAGGAYTVTASSGGKSGTASVTVTAGSGILGNNIVGTSTDPSRGNVLKCWRFQASSSFTAHNMQINLATGITGKMKVAIYSDNNGSPGSLLAASNQITNPSSGWVTFTLTGGQPIASGTYYWLAVWSNVGYTPRCQATGGTGRYITKTYGTWPNSLNNTKGPYTNEESIFAY